MALQNIQANFTGGELSAALGARVDLTDYNTAAKTLKNMFCHIQGGVSNRAGTQFLANFADTPHKFIKFQFSVEQAYALLFTNLRMFVLKDGEIVLINMIDSGTFKWTASGSGTDEYYLELDGGGDPSLNEVFNMYENAVKISEGSVGSLAVGEWDWGDNDTLGYDTVYVRLSDGADPDSKADGYLFIYVAFATPWATADLADLRSTQSADVLYMYHTGYEPREIIRTSHENWEISVTEYAEDPLEDRTLDDEQGTIIITNNEHLGNARVLTASVAGTFTEDMIGRTIRLGYENQINSAITDWGIFRVTGYTSGTQVTGNILDHMGSSYLTNWNFADGVRPWYLESDKSATSVAWIQVNEYLRLTATSAVCEVRTSVKIAEYSNYLLKVKSNTISTGTVTIKIGTTVGANDILNYVLSASTTYSEGFKVEDNSVIYVTIVTSATLVTANIEYLGLFGNISATKRWRVPAFKSPGAYPGLATFFEQRLVVGAPDDFPQTMWHSRTGGFYEFGFKTPLLDDDAIKYTIAGDSADGIRWVAPLREMLLGTADGVWKVSRGSQSSSMTPLSVDAKKKYGVGCEKLDPIILGTSVLYIERGATRIEQITYALESDEFSGFNITDMSAHLFKDKTIVDWTYARTPYSVIYCVLSDGTMAALTIDIKRKIYAWHHHETDGKYKNVIAIPGDTREDVYFVIERTIDSASKYYTEHLQPRITDKETGDWWFVDSGIRYSGDSATVFSGLGHLEGKTIKVLGDGGVQDDQVVSDAQVTIEQAASLVIIGLPYDQEIETLDLDLVATGDTSQGKIKNVAKVSFKVSDTRGFFAGTNVNYMSEPRLTSQVQGEGLIPPVTGIMELAIDSEFKEELSIIVRNSQPIPITILSIIPDIGPMENEDSLQQ